MEEEDVKNRIAAICQPSLVVLILILVSCSTTFASTATKLGWQIAAGLSTPTGDLAIGGNAGYHGRFAMIFRGKADTAASSTVRLLLETSFHAFPIDGALGKLSNGSISSVHFGGGGIISFGKFGSSSIVFLSASIGIGIIGVSAPGERTYPASSSLYFNPTAGVYFGKQFYVSFGYVSVGLNGSPATFFPLSAGLSF